MGIVHFYYPEMICYNYLLKSCEKNLNTLLANDNIPKANQFGAVLSRQENGGSKQVNTVVNMSRVEAYIRHPGSTKEHKT